MDIAIAANDCLGIDSNTERMANVQAAADFVAAENLNMAFIRGPAEQQAVPQLQHRIFGILALTEIHLELGHFRLAVPLFIHFQSFFCHWIPLYSSLILL